MINNMEPIIENDYITCGSCNFKFERTGEYRHCSNCIVCTGCEVYYCPHCDDEITVTPIKPIYSGRDNKNDGKPVPPKNNLYSEGISGDTST
jgi:hypothetical protein